jgi:hypothetical protein
MTTTQAFGTSVIAFVAVDVLIFMHEGGRRREGDTVAFLTGGKPQRQGDVGPAGARWPEREAVLPLLDPFAARQLQHQRFVERGLGDEVEGVETFDLRETRQADTALDGAPRAVDTLQFAKTKQIARVIGAILR